MENIYIIFYQINQKNKVQLNYQIKVHVNIVYHHKEIIVFKLKHQNENGKFFFFCLFMTNFCFCFRIFEANETEFSKWLGVFGLESSTKNRISNSSNQIRSTFSKSKQKSSRWLVWLLINCEFCFKKIENFNIVNIFLQQNLMSDSGIVSNGKWFWKIELKFR